MRRRVLLATISAVAAAVILLGVPLGIFGARYVIDIEHQRLSDRLDRLVSSVQNAQDADRAISETAMERAVSGREGDIERTSR